MSRKRPRTNRAEHSMARRLDELAQFERYQEDVLPILRRAIEKGLTATQIYADPKIQALIAARAVTIGVLAPESSSALTAIKDILDRSHGKAVERKVQVNKFAELKDEELDALLESESQTLLDNE